MSSSRPRNGLMNDAPALAAQTACAEEKQSVTFTLIPSSLRIRVASNPSSVSGHLTTTFGAILTYSRPCLSISSRSFVVVSAETGPETILHISAMCRSEEHTSELQSRGHLVCRLLLEKKND